MAEEHEIKVALNIPLEQFLGAIQSHGFNPIRSVRQTDSYFDTETWDLYRSVAALRIRAVEGIDKELTYKKLFNMPKRPNPWYVEEVEAAFPIRPSEEMKRVLALVGIAELPASLTDSHSAREIFESSGLLGKQVMHKVRRLYEHGNIEITIDDIEGMAPIVEVEGKGGDPLALLKNLLKDEEWQRSVEGTSYLWLGQNFGLTHHREHERLFQEKADWNVSPKERAWYDHLNQPADAI